MQISKFIKDVQGEMKNVKWPSKKMAIASTIAVIVISIVVGIFLYGLDTGLKKSYSQIVTAVNGELQIANATATSTQTTSTSTDMTKSTTTNTSTKATTSVIKK